MIELLPKHMAYIPQDALELARVWLPDLAKREAAHPVTCESQINNEKNFNIGGMSEHFLW